MSDERIKQIRERLEAATPGPWVVGKEHGPDSFGMRWSHVHSESADACVTIYPAPPDAALIANAPADIAYLLEQVEAARDAYGRGRDDEASGSPVVEYP